jgi:hypothetical protein
VGEEGIDSCVEEGIDPVEGEERGMEEHAMIRWCYTPERE